MPPLLQGEGSQHNANGPSSQLNDSVLVLRLPITSRAHSDQCLHGRQLFQRKFDLHGLEQHEPVRHDSVF